MWNYLKGDKHDHEPKSNQWHKVVKLVWSIHTETQANGEKVQSKNNLTKEKTK